MQQLPDLEINDPREETSCQNPYQTAKIFPEKFTLTVVKRQQSRDIAKIDSRKYQHKSLYWPSEINVSFQPLTNDFISYYPKRKTYILII